MLYYFLSVLTALVTGNRKNAIFLIAKKAMIGVIMKHVVILKLGWMAMPLWC